MVALVERSGERCVVGKAGVQNRKGRAELSMANSKDHRQRKPRGVMVHGVGEGGGGD